MAIECESAVVCQCRPGQDRSVPEFQQDEIPELHEFQSVSRVVCALAHRKESSKQANSSWKLQASDLVMESTWIAQLRLCHIM